MKEPEALLSECGLCPRNCGVNRLKGELGFCGAGDTVKVAQASLHHWEEPCISGRRGSGTVFFSNCNLRCVFCQNHSISQQGEGNEIGVARLSRIFLELQAKGAHNINLVTPTPYVPQIITALRESRQKGLRLPVVYNTGAYENVETIKMLGEYIDVYLPDLKYFGDGYALRYSGAEGYFAAASAAVREMVAQRGEARFDREKTLVQGVIIRHLMLPGLLFDSKKVVDFVHNSFGDSVYLSLMNQYIPLHRAGSYPEINKPLNQGHYRGMIRYCLEIGVKNAFVQGQGTDSEDFVPPFNLEGV